MQISWDQTVGSLIFHDDMLPNKFSFMEKENRSMFK